MKEWKCTQCSELEQRSLVKHVTNGAPDECPNCGGLMLAVHPDRYCAECIHEGRV